MGQFVMWYETHRAEYMQLGKGDTIAEPILQACRMGGCAASMQEVAHCPVGTLFHARKLLQHCVLLSTLDQDVQVQGLDRKHEGRQITRWYQHFFAYGDLTEHHSDSRRSRYSEITEEMMQGIVSDLELDLYDTKYDAMNSPWVAKVTSIFGISVTYLFTLMRKRGYNIKKWKLVEPRMEFTPKVRACCCCCSCFSVLFSISLFCVSHLSFHH